MDTLPTNIEKLFTALRANKETKYSKKMNWLSDSVRSSENRPGSLGLKSKVQQNSEAFDLEELVLLLRHRKPISNKELRHSIRQFLEQPESYKDGYYENTFLRMFQLLIQEHRRQIRKISQEFFLAD